MPEQLLESLLQGLIRHVCFMLFLNVKCKKHAVLNSTQIHFDKHYEKLHYLSKTHFDKHYEKIHYLTKTHFDKHYEKLHYLSKTQIQFDKHYEKLHYLSQTLCLKMNIPLLNLFCMLYFILFMHTSFNIYCVYG
jgi:hypothetical protein